VAASIALLSLGSYTFCLHQINAQLNNQKNTQKIASKNNTALPENIASIDMKQKHAKEITALLQEKVAAETLNKTVNQQNETLRQQVKQQENLLAELTKENQLLLKKNETCYLNNTTNQQQLKNIKGQNKQLEKQLASQQKRITQLELLNENWASAICLPKPGSQLNKSYKKNNLWVQPLEIRGPKFFSGQWMLGSKKKKSIPVTYNLQKRNRFEIGYTYTFSQPDIWIQNSFENQEAFPKTSYRHATHSNRGFNGLRIAWSPLNRFWIKTGINFSSQPVITSFIMDGRYYNEGEIYTPEKTVRNQLSLITKTEYAESINPISFEFNRGELLVNDPMQITINDIQDLNYFRIPLGLEYYYGHHKRLRGSVSGGVRLTRISGTHVIIANVNTNRTEINTINDEIHQPLKPKLFIDIYAGLGLEYQIFQNWHAKADFSLHNKYVKRDIYAAPKSVDLNLGLYYKF